MAYCQSCGNPVEGAYCAKCGAATETAKSTPPPPDAVLQDNLASALCYFPVIGSLAFLLVEPYNRNRLIRFHAFQSLFLVAAIVVVNIVLSTVVGIAWGLLPIVQLAIYAVIVVVAVKAYKGEKVVLPVIGPLAEKQV
jgi:uncharacterized membrane protein